MTVVALAGPKKSGKSTIAQWLVKNQGYAELSLAAPLKELALLLLPGTLTEKVVHGPSEGRDVDYSLDQIQKASLDLGAAVMRLRHDPDARELYVKLFAGAPQARTSREAADLLPQAFTPYEKWLASPRRILQCLGTEWGRAMWEEVWLNAVRRIVEEDRSKKYVIPDTRFINEAAYLKSRLNAQVAWVESEARVGPSQDAHASEPKRSDFIDRMDFEITNNGTLDELYATLSTRFA